MTVNPGGGGSRVLLFSMDTREGRRMHHLFSNPFLHQFEAVPCHDFQKAMSSLSQGQFQAIFLDLDPLDESSFQHLVHIHTHHPRIPLVAETSSPSACNDERLIRFNVQDCLHKDTINGEILGRTLRFAIERMHASERLDACEHRFESLIESSADGFLIMDAFRKVLFANPAALRLLSKSGSQILGRSFDFPFTLGEASEVEIPSDGPGSVRVEIQVVPTTWRQENHLIATLRDITLRKRDELEVRRQIDRLTLLNLITKAIAERQDIHSIYRVLLRYLEDQLPVDFAAIWLSSPGKDTFSVVATGLSSAARAERLSMEEGTLINSDRLGFLGPEVVEPEFIPDVKKTDTWLSRRLAAEGLNSLAMMPMRSDDKLIGLLVTAQTKSPGYSGADLHFLRQVCEHTALAYRQNQLFNDLQRTIENLRQTQKEVMRQERLRALGQMASGMVHDINNALSPIVGYTDMLLEENPPSNQRTRKYLENIKAAAEDITGIASRMRNFYRKRDEEPLLPVDVNTTVAQAVELTRPRWKDMAQHQERAIEVALALDDKLPPIAGIETELREAVANLIINALDAMPRGGVLRLSTRRKEEMLEIEVSDNGTGMDEATLAQCLEPFFTTKGDQGTGLGLAMVYGTMQRHEGRMKIESHPGKGTVISLLLPMTSPTREALPRGRPFELVPPLRILCIDDEPGLRTLIQEMLEQDGHYVRTVGNGQAGIDAFNSAGRDGAPFDVVITDLGMPYLSGREVAEHLKRLSPRTPVILLTGWENSARKTPVIDNQTDFTLGKPPTLKRLREALRVVRQSA